MLVRRKQNLAETGKGSYYKEERLEEFLNSKGAFYNVNETDNDDESCNENNGQQQLLEGFDNSCYKIVTSILLQKLINDFAVCKHQKYCSGRLLLAKDVNRSFGNYNYIFLKRTILFNRSISSILHFYVMLYKVYNSTLIS